MNSQSQCSGCPPQTTSEKVVLVDNDDKPIGTKLKSEVHQSETPLHQAFSCFIFRSNGDLVLQQRAASKITWPNIWSNTCCGHPLPEESRIKAVKRRLEYELGMNVDFECFNILPEYRYCATHLGVMENEICPVFVGFSDNKFQLNPEEVQAVKTINWKAFVASLKNPEDATWDHLSVWCREEAILLDESEAFQILYKKFIQ